MRKLILPVILFGSLVLVSAALAGPNANAKILVHVRPKTTGNRCGDAASVAPSCSAINTRGGIIAPPAPGLFIFLLVHEANGISAMRCAPAFPADLQIFSWTRCADADTVTDNGGSWTTSGLGNLITWDTCQLGTVVCAGYFYVGAYAPCTFAITGDPVDGLATVASCDSTIDIISGPGGPHPSHLGYASFSPGAVTPGYNPCGLNTPVMNSTWSSIKLNYGH